MTYPRHHKTSKSERKRLRLAQFNSMTIEQQNKNRFEFYTLQSSLPKYQRKLSNWDAKLTDSLRRLTVYMNLNREQAEQFMWKNMRTNKYIFRPSSIDGYVAITTLVRELPEWLNSHKMEHGLLKYEGGKLCSYELKEGKIYCGSSFESLEHLFNCLDRRTCMNKFM